MGFDCIFRNEHSDEICVVVRPRERQRSTSSSRSLTTSRSRGDTRPPHHIKNLRRHLGRQHRLSLHHIHQSATQRLRLGIFLNKYPARACHDRPDQIVLILRDSQHQPAAVFLTRLWRNRHFRVSTPLSPGIFTSSRTISGLVSEITSRASVPFAGLSHHFKLTHIRKQANQPTAEQNVIIHNNKADAIYGLYSHVELRPRSWMVVPPLGQLATWKSAPEVLGLIPHPAYTYSGPSLSHPLD